MSGDAANFAMIDRFGPLLHASFSVDSQLVLVERPWLEVMAGFAPSFTFHRYGRS